jgi:excinuclease ABC subunit B
LDIPEVGLVAILDADKEGFLRNPTSLIQTIGRAARNAGGEVVMYADRMGDAMKAAIEETDRRRAVQVAFNTEHGITPSSIIKKVGERLGPEGERTVETRHLTTSDVHKQIVILEEQMRLAAESLDFEKAIALRDQVRDMRKRAEGEKKKEMRMANSKKEGRGSKKDGTVPQPDPEDGIQYGSGGIGPLIGQKGRWGTNGSQEPLSAGSRSSQGRKKTKRA